MFNDKILKSVAEAVKDVLQQEALKGQQHKIDKNKNNKIDAHDFKILRGEKKPVEESSHSKEKPKVPTNNPFDVKNYKSQIPTKPGELAGFDSKKISTGTVYTRKHVKDEKPLKEEDAYDKDRYAVKDGKAVKDNPGHMGSANYKDQAHHVWASSAEEAMKKKGMKEEASNDEFHAEAKKAKEKSLGKQTADVAKPAVSAVKQEEYDQLDELSKNTLSSYVDKATDSARTMPGYGTKNEPGKKSKRMAAISVATSRIKKTNEEVEQLDELSRGTLTSYATSAGQSLGGAVATIGKAKEISKFYAKKTSPEEVKKDAIQRAGKRMVGLGRAASRLNKEELEQVDEREMTGGEMKKREKIVKSMKKGMQGFKDRYGDKAKNVMYATATKQAMKD